MAEWLGRGLQNLVQRFESASDLQKMLPEMVAFFAFCFSDSEGGHGAEFLGVIGAGVPPLLGALTSLAYRGVLRVFPLVPSIDS